MKNQPRFKSRALPRFFWTTNIAGLLSALVVFLSIHPGRALTQGGPWTTPSPELEARVESAAALTFAVRVAYQRAIEAVYWQHRIWPNANADPKPPLDKVMLQGQIEKKVGDYLRDSQALEDYWQEPITHDQLQAEMERMASHSKQPEVLREVFAALGNDPFVIAECLARPVLAQRLITERNNEDGVKLTRIAWRKQRLQSWFATAEAQVPVTMAAVSPNYTLPMIASPSGACADDTWTPTSLTNAPDGRGEHTAVWTGSEMIVWGGSTGFGAVLFNTGGRYNPSTDSWTATSTTSAPSPRFLHTAVWTGSEMIVWGGFDGTSSSNTGGRYNPSTDSWTATSTTNAAAARHLHSAVWTGSEMIVWAGFTRHVGWVNTGGRYNPATDSWTTASTTNVPVARWHHTAVWTGSEMIVWGGYNNGSHFDTGGRYNPTTDSWTATSTTNAPAARDLHTAVWTGSQMIVWGGISSDSTSDFNTGGRYNPGTDSWTATSTTSAPSARDSFEAVWTGSEMIAWGGFDRTSSLYLNTGGRYNPGTDSWTATSTINAPDARYSHRAMWTGSQMIVWGGTDDTNYFNTGGRYCAQPPLPVQITVRTTPAGLSFTVDGTTYNSTQRFSWVSGSSHTIATTSPQSGGTGVQYVWTKWSDRGPISHTVAPTTNTTYTATFKAQYFLTMTAGTGGRVRPNSGWKNSGAAVSISATPAGGYSFSNWTGTGAGSYSLGRTTRPQSQ